MRRIAEKLVFLMLVGVAAACGGGSDPSGPNTPPPAPPPPPPPPASAPMTATIDGVAWASTAQTIATYQASSNTYNVAGAEPGINPGRAMVISVMNVAGPGTYPLGTGLPFRYANVGSGGNVWETSVAQGAASSGSIVVTIATPTRFKATFSFTGVPAASSPNATGTKVVTNGAVDVTIP